MGLLKGTFFLWVFSGNRHLGVCHENQRQKFLINLPEVWAKRRGLEIRSLQDIRNVTARRIHIMQTGEASENSLK